MRKGSGNNHDVEVSCMQKCCALFNTIIYISFPLCSSLSKTILVKQLLGFPEGSGMHIRSEQQSTIVVVVDRDLQT